MRIMLANPADRVRLDSRRERYCIKGIGEPYRLPFPVYPVAANAVLRERGFQIRAKATPSQYYLLDFAATNNSVDR